MEGVNPPFMYFKKAYLEEPEEKWDAASTTIKSIFETIDPPLTVVCMSNIIVRVEEDEQNDD